MDIRPHANNQRHDSISDEGMHGMYGLCAEHAWKRLKHHHVRGSTCELPPVSSTVPSFHLSHNHRAIHSSPKRIVLFSTFSSARLVLKFSQNKESTFLLKDPNSQAHPFVVRHRDRLQVLELE